jgi:molybdopterin-guanine dinucleotide biosynthesis protein MobB
MGTPQPPVLGFAARSGTGKTTLLTKLIPLLRTRGLEVGVIKHAHHQFDIDQPGKDSYRLRQAGARQTLIASDTRRVLITEAAVPADPSLAGLVAALDPGLLDLVLVEGFRHEPYPKIELHRPALGKPLLSRSDPTIVAVASDTAVVTELPLLDLNQPRQIADFVLAFIQGHPR